MIFGVFLLIPLSMIPDALTALHQARQTGGRFDEHGRMISQDLDKSVALKWMGERLETRTQVLLHKSMLVNWAQQWSLNRPMRPVTSLPSSTEAGLERYVIIDTRYTTSHKLEKLTDQFFITAVGPFWLIDRGAPKAPIEGMTLREREPGLLQWYFVQGNDPMMTVEADPFHTWELRLHFDQQPNPPPSAQPQTWNQRRIAHNIALARGDRALAEQCKARARRGTRPKSPNHVLQRH